MAIGGNPDKNGQAVVPPPPEQVNAYSNRDFRKDDGVVFDVGQPAYNLLLNPDARDEAARSRLAERYA